MHEIKRWSKTLHFHICLPVFLFHSSSSFSFLKPQPSQTAALQQTNVKPCIRNSTNWCRRRESQPTVWSSPSPTSASEYWQQQFHSRAVCVRLVHTGLDWDKSHRCHSLSMCWGTAAKNIQLSTASKFNFIPPVTTVEYMLDADYGELAVKWFFLWMGFAYPYPFNIKFSYLSNYVWSSIVGVAYRKCLWMQTWERCSYYMWRLADSWITFGSFPCSC